MPVLQDDLMAIKKKKPENNRCCSPRSPFLLWIIPDLQDLATGKWVFFLGLILILFRFHKPTCLAEL